MDGHDDRMVGSRRPFRGQHSEVEQDLGVRDPLLQDQEAPDTEEPQHDQPPGSYPLSSRRLANGGFAPLLPIHKPEESLCSKGLKWLKVYGSKGLDWLIAYWKTMLYLVEIIVLSVGAILFGMWASRTFGGFNWLHAFMSEAEASPIPSGATLGEIAQTLSWDDSLPSMTTSTQSAFTAAPGLYLIPPAAINEDLFHLLEDTFGSVNHPDTASFSSIRSSSTGVKDDGAVSEEDAVPVSDPDKDEIHTLSRRESHFDKQWCLDYTCNSKAKRLSAMCNDTAAKEKNRTVYRGRWEQRECDWCWNEETSLHLVRNSTQNATIQEHCTKVSHRNMVVVLTVIGLLLISGLIIAVMLFLRGKRTRQAAKAKHGKVDKDQMVSNHPDSKPTPQTANTEKIRFVPEATGPRVENGA